MSRCWKLLWHFSSASIVHPQALTTFLLWLFVSSILCLGFVGLWGRSVACVLPAPLSRISAIGSSLEML